MLQDIAYVLSPLVTDQDLCLGRANLFSSGLSGTIRGFLCLLKGLPGTCLFEIMGERGLLAGMVVL